MSILLRLRRRGGFLACGFLLGGLAISAGCTEKHTGQRAPVVVIGVDGFDWKVAIDLLGQDKLPNLARLMQTGTFGELETMHPSLSPTVWASVATGMKPAQHGIRGFVKRTADGQQLFTNRDRRVKALWNMASDNGRRPAVIGWWSTFPVEPLHGLMVAQVNTSLDDRAGTRASLKGGIVANVAHQVEPEELSGRMLGIAKDVDQGLDPMLAKIFPRPASGCGSEGTRLWEESRWSLRADLAYERIAADVLKEQPAFDLFMVYFGGTDVLAHRFWRWAYPASFQFPPDEKEIAACGSILADYYRYIDGVIGRIVAAAPADSVILVMSDHGMDSTNRNKPFEVPSHAPPRRSGAHGRTNAFFVLSGPGIRPAPGAPAPHDLRRQDIPHLGSIFDVAPTVLALLDLPVGADMPGKPLADLLEPSFLAAHPLKTIPTHTPRGWFEGRKLPEVETPHADERLQQLRSLGYIQ